MPLYDWQCSCGLKFESISYNPKKKARCPACGHLAVRLLSTPAPPIIRGHNSANGYSAKPVKATKPGDQGEEE